MILQKNIIFTLSKVLLVIKFNKDKFLVHDINKFMFLVIIVSEKIV